MTVGTIVHARIVRRLAAAFALFTVVGIAVQQTLGAAGVSTTSPAQVTVCLGIGANGDCPPVAGPATPPPPKGPASTTTTPRPASPPPGPSPNGTQPPPAAPAPPAPPAPTPPPAPPGPPPPPPPPPSPPPAPTGPPWLVRSDGGESLFDLPNAAPGAVSTRCVTITYLGRTPVRLRLFGTGATNGLDQYVNLTVTRGRRSSTASASCSGFVPDAQDYLGAGAGVVYDGTFAGFPASYGAAGDDPVGAGADTWTRDESHAYRFRVEIQDDQAAQGLWLTQAFTWEARAF